MYKILIEQKRFLTRTNKVIEAKLELKIATGIELWITRTTTSKEICII